ncbi:hypothetical protein RN001_010838 [Aquatica leii]|uniref:Uncharacterized protein n=1 Tax=Aquatica leii TaxID=1421715 RepID=A0AAN7PWT9_9COLE|nr:hypothetical protein RN001_010838 [Aquatica leii]
MTAKEKLDKRKIYGNNYTQNQRDCVNDIIGNRTFRANKFRVLIKISNSMTRKNNSEEEVKCYYGCVFKGMGIINGSNIVVDENLRAFSEFITEYNYNVTEDVDDECADLEQKLEKRKVYGNNYTQSQRDCVDDIIGNRSFRANKLRVLMKISNCVATKNNSDEEVRCYYGCVFKKMGIVNGTNTVVDDNLRAFSEFITEYNYNVTEDVDDECADLEVKYKNITYCDMGFRLALCINQVFDKSKKP